MKIVQIRRFFWAVFSRIRIEYRDLRSKSPYSVQIGENTDQKNLHILTSKIFQEKNPHLTFSDKKDFLKPHEKILLPKMLAISGCFFLSSKFLMTVPYFKNNIFRCFLPKSSSTIFWSPSSNLRKISKVRHLWRPIETFPCYFKSV